MAFNQQEQQIIQWGIQNKKSKDEVTQAISNLRSGTIVKPQEEEKPNYFQRVGQDFQRAGERITTGIKEGATGIQQGDKFAGIEAGLRTVGSIAGAAFAPIMEAPGIKQATEAVVGGAMKIPAVQTLAQKGVELSQKYPNASKDIEDLINIATLGIGSTVEKPIQKVATDTAKGIAKGTENIASGVSKQVGKLAPKSEEIMNRVARLTPKEANNFSKLSGGVSHGEYLTKTGNFGAPDQIITKEAEKFAQSLSSKKAALAELPGVYKDGSLDDALDMLIAKAKNESGNNVKSPYLDEVLNLKTKLDNEGLTMLEGESVKSLLERNVKLGYNRLTNGEKVTQATNIDNAIREWQLGKAEELGFTNLREINKQTQLSRFIVDKLGDQVVGKTGLNNVGLTDWIMLSGGDPTAVGGFLTKRFFSNKSVQARIAKMLSKEAPVGQIEPKVTPSKLQSPQSPKIQSGKALPKSSTIPKTKSSPKGKGTIPENSLISEAKKYKSAEEFVKAKTNAYHGSYTEVKKFEDGYFGDTTANNQSEVFYFTKSDKHATEYSREAYARRFEGEYYDKYPELTGKDANGNYDTALTKKLYEDAGANLQINPSFVDIKKPKVINWRGESLAGKWDDAYEMIDNAKAKGYDGVIFKNISDDVNQESLSPQDVVIAFKKEQIMTKSQLTDIWKKSNK